MSTPYPAIIFNDDGMLGVMFPDLPGCVTSGYTLGDAIQKAGEALLYHMEYIAEQGGVLPMPSAKEKVELPAHFGRHSYTTVMVSPVMDYLQDIPPHW